MEMINESERKIMLIGMTELSARSKKTFDHFVMIGEYEVSSREQM